MGELVWQADEETLYGNFTWALFPAAQRRWLNEHLFRWRIAHALDLGSYINHSCDGNLWFDERDRMVARRQIEPDDEITVDYALFEGGPMRWQAGWSCECKSEHCRGRFTYADFRLPALRERYGPHFASHIRRFHGMPRWRWRLEWLEWAANIKLWFLLARLRDVLSRGKRRESADDA